MCFVTTNFPTDIFNSSAEKIRQQVLELNEDLRSAMWLDLNDFYYAIGLPNTKLEI